MNKDWGRLKLGMGSRTPWGVARSVTHFAAGIAVAVCADHGGMKLSRERNMAIPSDLRARSGWYEQDRALMIPGMFFPEETRPQKALGADRDWDVAEWQEYCLSRVRDAFPDGYERATGITVRPGESTVRDRSLWLAEHKDDWLAVSASARSDGLFVVTAKRDGEERKFLVPAAEYEARSVDRERGAEGTFVVDPLRHRQVGVTPARELPRFHGIRLTRLTAARCQRANEDLDGLWRYRDGRVRTVRDAIEVDGITGKTIRVSGTVREYLLVSRAHDEDHGECHAVSKALWVAVDAPDTRTNLDIAAQDADIAYLLWKSARGTPRAAAAREAYRKLAFEVELLHRGQQAA